MDDLEFEWAWDSNRAIPQRAGNSMQLDYARYRVFRNENEVTLALNTDDETQATSKWIVLNVVAKNRDVVPLSDEVLLDLARARYG
jgi:hypothetical protein